MEYCCGDDQENDLDILFKNCKKASGHSKFIQIADFCRQDISNFYSEHCLPWETLKPTIVDLAVRTVRIRVGKELPNCSIRPLRAYGTAYLMTEVLDPHTDQVLISQIRCPIENCSEATCAGGGRQQVWGPLHFSTAQHVFESDDEARLTEADFFYDEKKMKAVTTSSNGVANDSVVVAKCIEIYSPRQLRTSRRIKNNLDPTVFECVVHDPEFIEKFRRNRQKLSDTFDRNENRRCKQDGISECVGKSGGCQEDPGDMLLKTTKFDACIYELFYEWPKAEPDMINLNLISKPEQNGDKQS